ncbi:MAG: hypothetical protein KAX39_04975 [candidate division Zixibacteria bacterium]|nr:hypothetical protein [candidate division Zixibacteria bacterium]
MTQPEKGEEAKSLPSQGGDLGEVLYRRVTRIAYFKDRALGFAFLFPAGVLSPVIFRLPE